MVYEEYVIYKYCNKFKYKSVIKKFKNRLRAKKYLKMLSLYSVDNDAIYYMKEV